MSKQGKRFLPGSAPPQAKPSETLSQFVVAAQHFTGPIPPPEMLRRYEELLPGSADRIIAMAEKQSGHRQKLESDVIGANIINERLGMILGFIICILAISGGVYAVMHGKSVEGIAAIITPLAALVAVFVYGKSRQQKELQVRQQSIIEAAKHSQNR